MQIQEYGQSLNQLGGGISVQFSEPTQYFVYDQSTQGDLISKGKNLENNDNNVVIVNNTQQKQSFTGYDKIINNPSHLTSNIQSEEFIQQYVLKGFNMNFIYHGTPLVKIIDYILQVIEILSQNNLEIKVSYIKYRTNLVKGHQESELLEDQFSEGQQINTEIQAKQYTGNDAFEFFVDLANKIQTELNFQYQYNNTNILESLTNDAIQITVFFPNKEKKVSEITFLRFFDSLFLKEQQIKGQLNLGTQLRIEQELQEIFLLSKSFQYLTQEKVYKYMKKSTSKFIKYIIVKVFDNAKNIIVTDISNLKKSYQKNSTNIIMNMNKFKEITTFCTKFSREYVNPLSHQLKEIEDQFEEDEGRIQYQDISGYFRPKNPVQVYPYTTKHSQQRSQSRDIKSHQSSEQLANSEKKCNSNHKKSVQFQYNSPEQYQFNSPQSDITHKISSAMKDLEIGKKSTKRKNKQNIQKNSQYIDENQENQYQEGPNYEQYLAQQEQEQEIEEDIQAIFPNNKYEYPKILNQQGPSLYPNPKKDPNYDEFDDFRIQFNRETVHKTLANRYKSTINDLNSQISQNITQNQSEIQDLTQKICNLKAKYILLVQDKDIEELVNSYESDQDALFEKLQSTRNHLKFLTSSRIEQSEGKHVQKLKLTLQKLCEVIKKQDTEVYQLKKQVKQLQTVQYIDNHYKKQYKVANDEKNYFEKKNNDLMSNISQLNQIIENLKKQCMKNEKKIDKLLKQGQSDNTDVYEQRKNLKLHKFLMSNKNPLDFYDEYDESDYEEEHEISFCAEQINLKKQKDKIKKDINDQYLSSKTKNSIAEISKLLTKEIKKIYDTIQVNQAAKSSKINKKQAQVEFSDQFKKSVLGKIKVLTKDNLQYKQQNQNIIEFVVGLHKRLLNAFGSRNPEVKRLNEYVRIHLLDKIENDL